MNERIRELKNLASFWCDENIPEQYSEEINGYGIVWEEKFAELIARKCMIISEESEKVSDEWRCKDGKHIMWKIKEHFGVEE